ncbi:LysR family transcriptional regulator [Sedimentitalea nanhaiensis]|uniref:DNA-binding transcriptional regulator, LysR family n=1 Tax=Sedimentitalea nanhaiensis TaxID=999627 RepID=A0A1I7D911_9RHOB|nr:LysR family transcriptional regulator [Sedimentitalea nanhaiensis]SFU08095.1 DNA-binding transcriptional regulator, LysR family [Sedimentitalea nanhaiensis]
MLSQRALEAFREVMRCGTVSGAAEEMRVSQPAISRQIRDLEERLDLRLFTRHGGRITATPEAHEFWTEVERNLVGLKQIERAAEQIKRGQRATMTIAAAPVFALTVLPEAVAQLHQQQPRLTTSFMSMTTLPVVRQVALGQCQIGFGMQTHHKFEIDLISAGAFPYRFIATADHPLADKETIRVEDLAGQDFVGFEDSTQTGRNLDRLFAGMENPPLVRFRSYLSHIVSVMALRGLGIALVDPFTAETHEQMGGISRPFLSAERFEYSIIKAVGARLSSECDALLQTFEKLTDRHRR